MNLKHAYEKKLLAFTGHIGDLVHNKIKVVDASCTINNAATYLIDPSIDYLVILRNHIPQGIVDKKTFSKKIRLKKNGNEPITSIMNAQLISAQKNEPVLDTLMFMIKHNINLILVLDNKKPLGVITQQDWLSVQINYPTQLIKKIREAKSIHEISQLRIESKQVIWNTFIKEENAVSLTNIITVINDAIGKRIQQLAVANMVKNGKGEPPVKYAWVAMGSEGRKAQTIRTDQDNGIIFENVQEKDYEEVKNWFLEFADVVVNGLEKCGFPKCKGNIMANNPELCNSIDKWKTLFEYIITKADAKELLEASIYFDFRCIYGKKELVDELWGFLFESMDVHNFFLRHFSANLLEASRPPIKKWKWKLLEIFNTTPPPFDIKREGTAPLDAAIRLLALNNKISKTNTLTRLQLILEKGKMPKALADSVHVAFDFILKLRFKLEFTMENEIKSFDHTVDPKNLSAMELKKLKDTLKTIYKLQDYAFIETTGMRIPWSMK